MAGIRIAITTNHSRYSVEVIGCSLLRRGGLPPPLIIATISVAIMRPKLFPGSLSLEHSSRRWIRYALGVVQRGHPSTGVQPGQQCIADTAELFELLWREGVQHVAAHGRDVPGRRGDHRVPTSI